MRVRPMPVPDLYPGFEFNEELHEYRLNGVILPSVTTILKVLGDYAGVPADVLAAAAERGRAVHKITELHDLGMLDYSELGDDLYPYLDAYASFLAVKKPEIVSVEKRTYHPLLKYAGTLDREYVLDGKLTLVDIKSTYSMLPMTGPQTWAYAEAENAHRPKKADQIKARAGLQLKRDGTFELFPYKDDINDRGDWTAALRVHFWRVRNRK